MAVRNTMLDLISTVRLMIADMLSPNLQYQDIDIQNRLDANRDDIRYESLTIAASIVNTASTSNQASVIFADYYSRYKWWESDVVLQGNNVSTGAAWVVLTPASSDYIIGHWQFELTPFVNGTVPGQYPPVFATGKVYDLNAAAADLLEFWAASLAGAYDITVDGQNLRRSQLMQAKFMMADRYRRLAKPKIAKMNRSDVQPPLSTTRVRLLDSGDLVKGA
jgi:hypothetical protein